MCSEVTVVAVSVCYRASSGMVEFYTQIKVGIATV